jgi:SAM-dependent methyltransferase
VAAYSNAPHDYVVRYAEHLLDRPLKFANQLPIPSRILDLGCGPGRDLHIFSEYGHQPIGVELNPDFIRIASHHGNVVAGDIRNLDSLFSPASFDAIWAQAALHCWHRKLLQ